MKRPAPHYIVKPRYTPGSPDRVPYCTAKLLATQESTAYNRRMEGRYGEEAQKEAEEQGLSGIVEEWTEQRKSWRVRDMITNEVSNHTQGPLRRA